MIRSMTGFGRGVNSENGKKFIFEIKTVNHRYTDIYIKSPRSISFIEDRIRETLGKTLSRGKADIFVVFEDTSLGNNVAVLDRGLADSYMAAFKELSNEYDLKNDITAVRLAQFQDVIKIEKNELDQEEIWRIFQPAMNEAIEKLIAMREVEGENLKKDLTEKLVEMSRYIDNISCLAPNVVKEYKIKLENRIEEILGKADIDQQRLAMEVAIFADKCCIDEEITRLKSHISQFSETLEAGGQVGRKLDFLVQEMNREINTIGSKANDIEITKAVIELKSDIEKIREQIQNIE